MYGQNLVCHQTVLAFFFAHAAGEAIGRGPRLHIQNGSEVFWQGHLFCAQAYCLGNRVDHNTKNFGGTVWVCKPGPRNGGGGPQTISFVDRESAERECAKRECAKRECAKRELSDYTPQGREKIHRNNFRVSLPRCRAVRSWVGVCSFGVLCFVVDDTESEGGHPHFYAFLLTTPLVGVFLRARPEA